MRFLPHSQFTKRWLAKNSGTTTWRNVKFVHTSGYKALSLAIDMPEINSGESVEVSVRFPAITDPQVTSIGSYWHFVCNDVTFGPPLWLRVNVET